MLSLPIHHVTEPWPTASESTVWLHFKQCRVFVPSKQFLALAEYVVEQVRFIPATGGDPNKIYVCTIQ